jgi:hypothetical protein
MASVAGTPRAALSTAEMPHDGMAAPDGVDGRAALDIRHDRREWAGQTVGVIAIVTRASLQ